MNSYKWAVVGMLWFVCLFNYADRQAIFSVFPLLKKEMGLSDVELSVVGSSFGFVYGLCALPAGLIADRFRRKTLIIGGLIFWSAVTAATALSTAYWQLVLFRALEGLGETFYFPASMSLISDYHGKETRSRAMSLHQSSVYAGTILGGTAAGFLGQHYGWRSSFYLFGGLGVLLGMVLLGLLREPARGQSEAAPPATSASWAEFFRTPMAMVLLAVFIGANFVAMIFLTWMPSFLFNKFGMTLAMAGLNGTAWIQIFSVLGVLTGGVLADRLARKHRGGRPMTQALGLFLGIPFLFVTGWTMNTGVLVIAMSCYGFSKGMYDANIWASLYDVVPVARRATSVGIMNSVGWMFGSFGPVAIASASQRFGFSACLSATSAIYLLFGVLMTAGIRRYLRNT